MKISWLGHACFYIELESGTKIVNDPYQPGSFSGAIQYLPIGLEADIVTVSHHHSDHDCTESVAGAEVVDSLGELTIKDVTIETVPSYHDDSKGAIRGENIIFLINAESLKIAHFGDVGTLDLDYTKLKDIDIAMIPVGGRFTIDHKQAWVLIEKINPKIVIPMHFKTVKLDFDIDGLDKFLSGKCNIERGEFLTVTKDTLPDCTKVYALQYLR